MSLVVFQFVVFNMDYKNERIVHFFISHQYYKVLYLYTYPFVLLRPVFCLFEGSKVFSKGAFTTLTNVCPK